MYYSKKDKNYTPKELTIKEAKLKAEAICARSEKSVFDIEKKLNDWKVSEEDKNIIIDELIDAKFLDDERFACFYVRDKYRFNRWGRIKITHSLRQKGITSSTIKIALEEVKEEEYQENLEELMTAKYKSTKGKDAWDIKNKVIRFAQGRGYEPDLIFRTIERIQIDREDEEL